MYYFMKKYLHPDGEAGATPPPSKVFTQEEVSRMMAEEKRQGRMSVLKELGVEDEASAKDALSKYQAGIEAQKSDLQKAQDAIKAEQESRAQAPQLTRQVRRRSYIRLRGRLL